MSSARTYLDHNATSPLRPEARAAMLAALDVFGNPSSVHAEGRAARAIVDDAREKVARLVNCEPAEVVFTSGATEANNWIVGHGSPNDGWKDVLVDFREHDSIHAPAMALPSIWPTVPLENLGFLKRHLETCAKHDEPHPMLIALQLANNETGVLMQVAEAAALAADAPAVWVHTDAVQALGRIPVDFAALGVHSMAMSSHKIGGPKGVGALVIRSDRRLGALIAGGGQERGLRAGTENVVAIAGFGAAAEAALRDLADMGRIAAMRDRLEREAKSITPDAYVVGERMPRLPNTTCIADPWRKAETMVIAFDLAGIAVSAGAACSSGKVGKSRVLERMSLPRGVAGSAIRVSLGWSTTEADIDTFLAAWTAITAKGRPVEARAEAFGS